MDSTITKFLDPAVEDFSRFFAKHLEAGGRGLIVEHRCKVSGLVLNDRATHETRRKKP